MIVDKKLIIGIVSKPVRYESESLWHYDELVDDLRYIIVKNGAIAIGILPTSNTMNFNRDDTLDKTILSKEELNDLYEVLDKCDGIILEGGLSSSAYEVEIAKYAIKMNKPILGICAGFNNLIRALGGDVVLDTTGKHNIYSKDIAHNIKIEKNTRLFNIFNEDNVKVNSIHTMIANDFDIKEFKISAHSEDGLVEAIELDNKKFVMGIKWHPELMLDIDNRMNKIFIEFLKVCR